MNVDPDDLQKDELINMLYKSSLIANTDLSCCWCVAVRCGVLRCVAVCCSVLQCVVVCSSVLQTDCPHQSLMLLLCAVHFKLRCSAVPI